MSRCVPVGGCAKQTEARRILFISKILWQTVIPEAIAVRPSVTKVPPLTDDELSKLKERFPEASRGGVPLGPNPQCGCWSAHAGGCLPDMSVEDPQAWAPYVAAVACVGDAFFTLRPLASRHLLACMAAQYFHVEEQALVLCAKHGALGLARTLVAEWYKTSPPVSVPECSSRLSSAVASSAPPQWLTPPPPPWFYSGAATPGSVKTVACALLEGSCGSGNMDFVEWVMSLHGSMISRGDMRVAFISAALQNKSTVVLDWIWERVTPPFGLEEVWIAKSAITEVVLQRAANSCHNISEWLMSHFKLLPKDIGDNPRFAYYLSECAKCPQKAPSLLWFISYFHNQCSDYAFPQALNAACVAGSMCSVELIFASLSIEEVSKLSKDTWDPICAMWICEKISQPRPQGIFSQSCIFGHLELAQSLAVELGVTALEVRAQRHHLLSQVLGRKHFNVARWLLDRYGIARGKGPRVLRMVCRAGNLDFAQWLVARFTFQQGAAKCNRNSALSTCCRDGNIDLVKWLVGHFSLTAQDARSRENGALRACCDNGHFALAQWIADHFSLTTDDARSRNNYALRVSLYTGRLAVAKWLIKRFSLTSEDVASAIASISIYWDHINKWLASNYWSVYHPPAEQNFFVTVPSVHQVHTRNWTALSSMLSVRAETMTEEQLAGLLNGWIFPAPVLRWLVERTSLRSRFARARTVFPPVMSLLVADPTMEQMRWIVSTLGIHPGDDRIDVSTVLLNTIRLGNNRVQPHLFNTAVEWVCEYFNVTPAQAQPALDYLQRTPPYNTGSKAFLRWFQEKTGTTPSAGCLLQ